MPVQYLGRTIQVGAYETPEMRLLKEETSIIDTVALIATVQTVIYVLSYSVFFRGELS